MYKRQVFGKLQWLTVDDLGEWLEGHSNRRRAAPVVDYLKNDVGLIVDSGETTTKDGRGRPARLYTITPTGKAVLKRARTFAWRTDHIVLRLHHSEGSKAGQLALSADELSMRSIECAFTASRTPRQIQMARALLAEGQPGHCLLYTSPSPRDQRGSRMPSSA